MEDLSLGGARISTDRTLETGRELWLKLDEHELFGTVTWAKAPEYGIQFEERLPKAVLLQVQDFSRDLEKYETAQGRVAARTWVLGEGQAARSPLMRLLDVVSPAGRDYPSCPRCERGEPCLTHCGHKQRRRARRVRISAVLGVAALIGAAAGIGSVLLA